MAYQALLFCPEEKTARTVTQVLSELEFSVEPCTEPFAAVKKLMSQHFDAVVVDCDNEQNATLLFKSARNSTSNQASLAVAIVEGQAGVAKAFRIGANLVLTKPINVEQSKGTLRVARGLLRKGEPVKPAAAAAPTATTPVPAPPNAPAAKPVPPVKAETASVPVAAVPPRPSAPPVAKPAASLAQARTAAASRTIPPVRSTAPAKTPAPATPVVPVAESKAGAPPVIAKPPEAAAVAPKPTFVAAPEGPAGTFSGGAASAPAPAREVEPPQAKEAPAESKPHEAEDLFEKPAAPAHTDSSNAAPIVGSAPSFTFGGANEPEPSGGIAKKLLPIAAIMLLAAGAYFGWNYYQGRAKPSTPIATPPTVSTPVQPSTTPASAPIKPSASSSMSSQPQTTPPVAPQPAETAESNEPGAVSALTIPPTSVKSNNSAPAGAGKSATALKPAPEPLIVKGGSVPVARPTEAADAAAPSLIGIAAAGSNGALSDIAGTNAAGPQPVLQTLNVSQGVSQGLVLKRVQPIYPKNALSMRIEGSVELSATISKSGSISSVKVLKGDAQLSRAAVDAVKQWKYKPYLLNGEPVEIQTQITVKFKLPN